MRELSTYRDDLTGLAALHQREIQTLPRAEVDALRLAVAADRFAALKDRIAALGKLAATQGVSRIDSFDDLAPVLFQHTVYKSYPPSLIEKGNFKALTRWLDQLTVHDLSAFDSSEVRGLDDWFFALQDQTPITAIHTTGTSGRLSIIPRTDVETAMLVRSSFAKFEGVAPGEHDCPLDAAAMAERPFPIITPTYRHGFYSAQRSLDYNVRTIGAEDQVYALYDELLSPDVLSLSGRVAAAEARGALDELVIPEWLIQRFTSSRQHQRDKAADEAALFERVVDQLAGRRVILTGVTPLLYPWAKVGMERGIKGLFAGNSWISSGGGKKGAVIPDDWQDLCAEVFGSPISQSYGMSEIVATNAACSRGNYHVAPYLLAMILDPETGEALPRHGTQTGRAAFLDLLVESYWAGFITGDRVTLHYDGDCGCGRTSEYFEPAIARFSDLAGGDDKISCAGAPDAQEKAMAFINQIAETA